MTDILCPYCDQVRPSRSRLQLHVDNVHRYADSPQARAAAVKGARTIVDVPTPTVVQVDLDKQAYVCSYCLAGNLTLDELAAHMLHAHQATPSGEPAPVPPTVQEQIDAAGKDIAYLAGQVEDVIRRVEALDTPTPAQIRRATLNEVLDMLAIRKDYQGVSIVRHLIEREGGQS